MSELTISQLVERSHALSKEKGWYETWPDGRTKDHVVNVPEKLALIHSEVNEALEEFRNHGVRIRCGYCNGTGARPLDNGTMTVACECVTGFLEIYAVDGKPKPEGVVVELADVVIRVADLCGALGLDLAAAIERKHAYNTTRAFRHGGKAC
jgi:hypothetical protein